MKVRDQNSGFSRTGNVDRYRARRTLAVAAEEHQPSWAPTGYVWSDSLDFSSGDGAFFQASVSDQYQLIESFLNQCVEKIGRLQQAKDFAPCTLSRIGVEFGLVLAPIRDTAAEQKFQDALDLVHKRLGRAMKRLAE